MFLLIYFDYMVLVEMLTVEKEHLRLCFFLPWGLASPLIYKTIFMTFTVHEVQAKLQELQYCMRAQLLDNHLGGVIKYLLKFSLILIT